MDTALLDLIKAKNFSLCQINAQTEEDLSKFQKEYEKLETAGEGLFQFLKYTDNGKTVFRLLISIPDWDELKTRVKVFEDLLKLLEKSLLKETQISIRTVFSYSPENFRVDPELPIVFEEKSNYGKLILSGIRIKLPDVKEIDSVIIDLHKCPKCDGEHIFVQVFSDATKKYSLSLIKDSIITANKFSSNFIKSKKVKNVSKNKK